MGYTFVVGNAVPKFSKVDFPKLRATWEVEKIELPDAPNFINDPTGRTNARDPSYLVWSNFCKAVGLYEWFYDDRGRPQCGHPGIIGITNEDVDLVTERLKSYQAKATFPPGFEEKIPYEAVNYDYHLARLIWLEWWMRWAVENCETPAIQNW